MLGSINRTVRGIEITPDTLSAQVIADVVRGEGHFLGHPKPCRSWRANTSTP